MQPNYYEMAGFRKSLTGNTIQPLPLKEDEWMELFGDHRLAVAGKIAAGKSTFMKNFRKWMENKPFVAFIEEEKVDNGLLTTYIKDQTAFAEVFQTERAITCQLRQEIVMEKMANAKAKGLRVSGWVERELFENETFAVANQKCGFISEKFMTEFYRPMLQAKNNYPCDLSIYLHTPDRQSAHNMEVRAREGEDSYDDEYLAQLGEAYFNFVIDQVHRGRMLVIDWTNYGEVEPVLRLAAEVLSGKKKLPVITFTPGSDDELTSSAGVTKLHKSGAEDKVILACSQPSRKKKGYHDSIIKGLANFWDAEIFI